MTDKYSENVFAADAIKFEITINRYAGGDYDFDYVDIDIVASDIRNPDNEEHTYIELIDVKRND